jgi:glycosyltransferase involved in cell wall biosynthesis
VSAYHPTGVYQGEEEKRRELTASLPSYLIDRLIAPAAAAGRTAVVLSEEWQTAELACILGEMLENTSARGRALLVWNANNPYSFDRIDWARLARTNNLTTVSRYMRSIMRARGVDAHVVPNGIPRRLLQRADRDRVRRLRSEGCTRPFFFKMARWEREKGWDAALDAIAALRRRGQGPRLVARTGGPTNGGHGIAEAAAARGLTVADVPDTGSLDAQLAAIAGTAADVVNLRFGVREPLSHVLYGAADGVLANSVSEPFGLVGLEAMAAKGLVYTGGTGEDYAIQGRNAIVLETLGADEIVDRAEQLARRPEAMRQLRRAAHLTARSFTWESVLRILLNRLELSLAATGR